MLDPLIFERSPIEWFTMCQGYDRYLIETIIFKPHVFLVDYHTAD